jgi:hypothetical protein
MSKCHFHFQSFELLRYACLGLLAHLLSRPLLNSIELLVDIHCGGGGGGGGSPGARKGGLVFPWIYATFEIKRTGVFEEELCEESRNLRGPEYCCCWLSRTTSHQFEFSQRTRPATLTFLGGFVFDFLNVISGRREKSHRNRWRKRL